MGALAADLASVLLTEAQIQTRVGELAETIAGDYAGRNPLLVGVMKGSIVFLSDLMRRIGIPLQMDLICVSSYGQSAQSSSRIELLKDLSFDLRDRHVLVVEDIVDSGVTLSHLLDLFRQRHPASLAVCALLDKSDRREVEVPITYTGFEIPNEFVVGYGLDYAEKYRNLPYVAVLKPEVYL